MTISQIGIIISILVYLCGMLIVGFVSSKETNDVKDFYLGGRKLGPFVTAMSAEASDMSSYLLMGLPTQVGPLQVLSSEPISTGSSQQDVFVNTRSPWMPSQFPIISKSASMTRATYLCASALPSLSYSLYLTPHQASQPAESSFLHCSV